MERDALVAWLERGDHFQRATGNEWGHVQPPSSRVWGEAAAAVNAAVLEAQWTSRSAYLSLRACFKESESERLRYYRLLRLHARRHRDESVRDQEQQSVLDFEEKEDRKTEVAGSLSGIGLDEEEEEDEDFPVQAVERKTVGKAAREEVDGGPWLRRKLRRMSRFSETAEDSKGAEVSTTQSTRNTNSNEPRRPASIDVASSQQQESQSSDSDTPLAHSKKFNRAHNWKVARSSIVEEKLNQEESTALYPHQTVRNTTSDNSQPGNAPGRVEKSGEPNGKAYRADVTFPEPSRTASDINTVSNMLPASSSNPGTLTSAPRHSGQESGSSRYTKKPHEGEVLVTQTSQAIKSSATEAPGNHITTDTNMERPLISNGKPSQSEASIPQPQSLSSTHTDVLQRRTEHKQTAAPRRVGRPPKSGTPSSGEPRDQTQAPNALRSAIAQVVSQRQQLLSSRSSAATHIRARPGNLSPESDADAADAHDDGRRPAEQDRGVRRGGHKEEFDRGFQPPLFNAPPLVDDHQDMKRKRAYLRAKQLAFDQMRWNLENELQKREVALLRREMEAREMLAHKELELKQLRIRAEIMLPMIRDGANPADIADQLKLL